jgi:hypothetical protein
VNGLLLGFIEMLLIAPIEVLATKSGKQKPGFVQLLLLLNLPVLNCFWGFDLLPIFLLHFKN